MRHIPFTQFLRPDGRQRVALINRPDEVAEQAERIIAAGYHFECEELSTGHVSFAVSNGDGDHDIEVCLNGPGVPVFVDRLIIRFAATLDRRKEQA